MKLLSLVRSSATAQYTDAIDQNASENENIQLPPYMQAVGAQLRVTALSIISVQNLAWELWLFGSNAFQTADFSTDQFLGFWGFNAADARRVNSGTYAQYYYYIDGLNIPYVDRSASSSVLPSLHAALVNRSASAKIAGALGNIVVQATIELERS